MVLASTVNQQVSLILNDLRLIEDPYALRLTLTPAPYPFQVSLTLSEQRLIEDVIIAADQAIR